MPAKKVERIVMEMEEDDATVFVPMDEDYDDDRTVIVPEGIPGFGVSVEERLITGIFAAVVDVVDILRTIVFLILGLKSLKMRTIIVPSAENIINKIM